MTLQEVVTLVCIGLFAGILSGFVGVGGGIVIVPALVYALGFTQHQAQGTSLFVLAMPVVLLAVLNYAKTGNVHWKFGLVIAATFVIGGFIRIVIFLHDTNECDSLYFILNSTPLVLEHTDVDNVL